ncbi:MAG: hypothetical protein ABJA70_09545 [Chryseolinea sp.]
MGSDIRRFYRLISVLSIDVVAGAVIGSIFFAHILQAQIQISELVALALTVWIIYTADHLSDAKKIKRTASTDRHRFHQQHAQHLKSILAICLLIDGAAVLFINPEIIKWGVVLAFLVLVFLIIQQSIPWMKEIVIAVFYTCGVILPSISRVHNPLDTAHYLLILQFMMIALTNLMLFSWFDRTTDAIDGLRSFVTVAGESKTRIAIITLAFLQLLLTGLQYFVFHIAEVAFLMGIMGVILGIIFLLQRKYDDSTLARFLAEAVFLIPIVSLL